MAGSKPRLLVWCRVFVRGWSGNKATFKGGLAGSSTEANARDTYRQCCRKRSKQAGAYLCGGKLWCPAASMVSSQWPRQTCELQLQLCDGWEHPTSVTAQDKQERPHTLNGGPNQLNPASGSQSVRFFPGYTNLANEVLCCHTD